VVLAAVLAGERRLTAAALAVPASLSSATWVQAAWGTAQGQDPAQPAVSPLRAQSLAGLPPALVVTAEVDALRDEAEAYAARLTAAGVRTHVKRFAGHWHNSMLQDTVFDDRAQLCYDDVAAFLREVCAGQV